MMVRGKRMPRVFDFNRAIVRTPGDSAVNGLREDARAAPDIVRLRAEHAAYVSTLCAAGLEVEVLPPLEAYPDSMFVEDPALVFPEGAILLRPGAPSRTGETAEIRRVLQRHFEQVLELDDGYADGGDVLVTPDVVFIGMSARTDLKGARNLSVKLRQLGRKSRIVETPASVLHLKTASSLIDERAVLVARVMAGTGAFPGFDVVVIPEGEEAAANALRVNDTVLVGDRFPRTIELLVRRGLNVKALPVAEVGKLDAGLSCMSLRWWAPG